MTSVLERVFFPNTPAAIEWTRMELIPELERSITFRAVRKFYFNRRVLCATTVVLVGNRLEVFTRVRPLATVVANHFKDASYDYKFRVLMPGRYWVTVYLPPKA
jgi:hypothetical protein